MSQVSKGIVAVVDDNHSVREALHAFLEQAGFAARLFESASEFLNDSEFATFDCLISDIGMSNMDGFELQQLIAKLRPTLPVILITGRKEFASEARKPDRGGRLLLEKPFDTRVLLAAVEAQVKESKGYAR